MIKENKMAKDLGKIIQIVGVVVDVEFSRDVKLPAIYDALHVKNGKVDIVDENHLNDPIGNGRNINIVRADEQDDVECNEPKEQIHRRACDGDENIIPFRLAKITGIDHHGFRPTKAHEKQHNQPDWVNVCTRVKRQTAHKARREIPERYSSTRMCILVKRHGNDEPGDTEQHLFKIKSEHLYLLCINSSDVLVPS